MFWYGFTPAIWNSYSLEKTQPRDAILWNVVFQNKHALFMSVPQQKQYGLLIASFFTLLQSTKYDFLAFSKMALSARARLSARRPRSL